MPTTYLHPSVAEIHGYLPYTRDRYSQTRLLLAAEYAPGGVVNILKEPSGLVLILMAATNIG